MIPVAFTWYPEREPEQTVHTQMPQVPSVGDSVALAVHGLPIMRVSHVRWVEELGDVAGLGGKRWVAEASLGR